MVPILPPNYPLTTCPPTVYPLIYPHPAIFYPSVHLSIYPSVHLLTYSPSCLFLSGAHPCTYLPIHLPVYPFTHPPTQSSSPFHLPVYPPMAMNMHGWMTDAWMM